MNSFSIIVLLSAICFASAESDNCMGGCAPGYSCRVLFTATIMDHTYIYRKCVEDGETVVTQELLKPSSNSPAENFRRTIIRTCTPETVAEDCGKKRCCLGGKYCSPFLLKYIPCNLKNAHKCECADGLVCKDTYSFKIPVIGITLTLKQCMEPEENTDVKEVEMTEN
ncbi:uncharacterized protein LOC114521912 [Dendronephthya gigantea]|uniref:uncharacterized protein LOC114521912 n=1 Tax=Dendronephthya gigantea TaxID=151771 RepID=UPI00106D0C00|nr:uncharacterized protein LOC114521912 [Dendronephthya gigantea]